MTGGGARPPVPSAPSPQPSPSPTITPCPHTTGAIFRASPSLVLSQAPASPLGGEADAQRRVRGIPRSWSACRTTNLDTPTRPLRDSTRGTKNPNLQRAPGSFRGCLPRRSLLSAPRGSNPRRRDHSKLRPPLRRRFDQTSPSCAHLRSEPTPKLDRAAPVVGPQKSRAKTNRIDSNRHSRGPGLDRVRRRAIMAVTQPASDWRLRHAD